MRITFIGGHMHSRTMEVPGTNHDGPKDRILTLPVPPEDHEKYMVNNRNIAPIRRETYRAELIVTDEVHVAFIYLLKSISKQDLEVYLKEDGLLRRIHRFKFVQE